MHLDLPQPIAFVFSGGAALGALHVGKLEAVFEQGIQPDLIVGTSVGSLNGAIVASEPKTSVERLRRIWGSIRREDVFPGGWLSSASTILRYRTHLYSSRGLENLITRSLPASTFEDLALPLSVIATDNLTGHGVVLSAGRLVSALLASSAIPGIFPPVKHQGVSLVDGGLAANVALLQAIDLGAQSIVVFDAAGLCHRSQEPRNVAEALLFSSSILLRQQVARDCVTAAVRVPVIYPPARCIVGHSPLDFSQSAELMRDGYEPTKDFFRNLKLSGPGLYGGPHIHE